MDIEIFVLKKIKSLLIIFFGIILLCSNAYSLESITDEELQWQSPIPRFQALGINPEHLVDLVDDKITLLVHPEKKLSIDNAEGKKIFKKARLVSAFTVIDAQVKNVKEVIKNYENYTEIMPRTEKATVIQKKGRHSLVEYLLVFKLPIMSLKIKYIFQYTEEKNGDISIRLREGTGEEGASRWEFIPLSNGRTLLVFTTWNDLENSGYFFKKIVKAQPGLKATIPEISATLAIDSIKKQFVKHKKSSRDKYQFIPELKTFNKPSNKKLPQIPVFNVDERKAIALLSEFGMILVLHPKRNFKNNSEIIRLEYISLINKDKTSVENHQGLLFNFDNYVDFLPQLDQIHHEKTDRGFYTEWYFKYKFGILTLPVQYSLDYLWLDKNTLYFYLVGGGFESFYGSFSWYPIKDDDLFQYTLAINIGDDLPFALKVLNKLPRSSLLAGLFMGTNFFDSQKQWLKNRKE